MTTPQNPFKGLMGEDEGISTLREFFKPEDVEFKTDLNGEQIGLILEAEAVNSYFQTVWGIDLGYKVITNSFKQHQVSLGRKGRAEAMDVLEAHREALLESKTHRSLIDRLTGRGGP